MSLIKTTDELKLYFSSIDKDYKIASLQSFITDAEQDLLIPWIGQDIYDVVSAAYNPGPVPAGILAGLLPYLQKAVIHLALMLSADSGSFRISDSGFYVISTTTNKPVSDKKMTQFKTARREAGYRAMEQAIEYLEANITAAGLAAYAGSDQHKYHRAYFINSSVEFTRYFKKTNNSAYLFWQMLDSLDYAERGYIAPVLGPAYFDTLKAAVLANNLTDPQKALLPYINRALANYTVANAVPGLPVDFEGTNLIINSQPTKGNFDAVEDKTAASGTQLANLVNNALATGRSELRSLADYLVAHAEDLTGYILPETTTDVNVNAPLSKTFFV